MRVIERLRAELRARSPRPVDRAARRERARRVGDLLVANVARRMGVYPTDYTRETVVATLEELFPTDCAADEPGCWAEVAAALRRGPGAEKDAP